MNRRAPESDDVDLLVERWVSSGMRAFEVKRKPGSPGAKAFTSILALDKQAQLRAVRRTITLLAEANERHESQSYDAGVARRKVAAGELLSAIGRRKLPYSDQDLIHILEGIHRLRYVNSRSAPLKPVVSICERGLEGRAPMGVLEHLLKKLRDQLDRNDFANERALIARIDRLLQSEPEMVLDDRDVWARSALDLLTTLPGEERQKWQMIFAHAASSKGANPTGKWRHQANRLVRDIGERAFARVVVDWFSMVDLDGYGPRGKADFDDRELPHGQNAEVLRGLASCCIDVDDPELASALGELGAASFEEIRGHGRRGVGVGNACVVALGSMPGTESIAQLERLRREVRMPNVERLIDTELERHASRANQNGGAPGSED